MSCIHFFISFLTLPTLVFAQTLPFASSTDYIILIDGKKLEGKTRLETDDLKNESFVILNDSTRFALPTIHTVHHNGIHFRVTNHPRKRGPLLFFYPVLLRRCLWSY